MGDVVNFTGRPAVETPAWISGQADAAIDSLGQLDPTLPEILRRRSFSAATVADLLWQIHSTPDREAAAKAGLLWSAFDLAETLRYARTCEAYSSESGARQTGSAWARVREGIVTYVSFASESHIDVTPIIAALSGHPSTQEDNQP